MTIKTNNNSHIHSGRILTKLRYQLPTIIIINKKNIIRHHYYHNIQQLLYLGRRLSYYHNISNTHYRPMHKYSKDIIY